MTYDSHLLNCSYSIPFPRAVFPHKTLKTGWLLSEWGLSELHGLMAPLGQLRCLPMQAGSSDLPSFTLSVCPSSNPSVPPRLTSG